mgnify:CR=1 FL=1
MVSGLRSQVGIQPWGFSPALGPGLEVGAKPGGQGGSWGCEFGSSWDLGLRVGIWGCEFGSSWDHLSIRHPSRQCSVLLICSAATKTIPSPLPHRPPPRRSRIPTRHPSGSSASSDGRITTERTSPIGRDPCLDPRMVWDDWGRSAEDPAGWDPAWSDRRGACAEDLCGERADPIPGRIRALVDSLDPERCCR